MSLVTFLPTREVMKELLGLALPVAFVQVGIMAMGLVDTAMVGRVSAVDLGAVALGNGYFFTIAVFGMGLLFALDPVVSQAVGARDPEGIARAIQRGIVLALALAILASLALFPADALLGIPLLRQDPEVVPLAGAYARALIPGMFAFYGFIVLRQSLQGMGLVRPVVITIVIGNAVNVFLNWILVFGNLGSPALGAVGSSWGTSISRWFMLVTLMVLAWKQLRPFLAAYRPEVSRLKPLRRIVEVGAPIGVHQGLEFGVFAAALFMMGSLGAVTVSAHQVALMLAAQTFMVPVGIAQATVVLVGRAVGARNPRGTRRAAGAGLLAGAGFMTLTAALFIVFPRTVSEIFTNDPEVVAITALLIPIAGVFQVFDGIQVVAAGALRGIADTRVPMLISLVAFWAIGLPVSWLFGFTWGHGPEGIWWGLAVGIAVVALLLLVRMRLRFARTPRRLVIDEAG